MKYYAEFLYPGVIVSDSSIKEITEQEYANPTSIKIPENSFGFRVMCRTEIIREGDPLIGQYHGTSGWYYTGTKMSKQEVADTKGKGSILYRNMENNGYDFVVMTQFGQAIPLGKKDVLIEV